MGRNFSCICDDPEISAGKRSDFLQAWKTKQKMSRIKTAPEIFLIKLEIFLRLYISHVLTVKKDPRRKRIIALRNFRDH